MAVSPPLPRARQRGSWLVYLRCESISSALRLLQLLLPFPVLVLLLNCNGITISHLTFETSENFPRPGEIVTRIRRPRSLHLTLDEVKRLHGIHLWRVIITRDGEELIEIISRISPSQRIRIDEEFGGRSRASFPQLTRAGTENRTAELQLPGLDTVCLQGVDYRYFVFCALPFFTLCPARSSMWIGLRAHSGVITSLVPFTR